MKTKPEEEISEFDDPFKPVKNSDYKLITEILRDRLPISAHLYNMSLILNDFPDEMEIYSLHGEMTNDTAIILIIFNREDYEQDINLSIPNSFHVTKEIKDAFTITKRISWQGTNIWTAIDRRISHMIFQISTLTYRNSIIFNPNYCYAMSIEDALNFEIEKRPEVEIKSLDSTVGVEFLMKMWKYSRPGAEGYLKKIINNHISAGVYVKGEIVSAALVNGHGMIGVLNTSKDHQRKGYAQMCMIHINRELAKRGFIPVSSAQQENYHSLALHEKVGMKITHETDYMIHIPYLKK